MNQIITYLEQLWCLHMLKSPPMQTKFLELSILVHDECQNYFCEVCYECLLQLLDITTASFAFILIEAVIILWVIVLIFLSITCTTDISGMIFEEQQVVKNT